MAGELPLLHVKISDKKIQNVFELVNSIPLPNMGSTPSTPTEKVDCSVRGCLWGEEGGGSVVC